ncbi:hypothetical protein Peur_016827 [Populus x canadensis]
MRNILCLLLLDSAAGIYLSWGFLVWLPCVYSSPGMYLVNHPVNLGIQALSAYISLTIVTGKSKNFAELMASV